MINPNNAGMYIITKLMIVKHAFSKSKISSDCCISMVGHIILIGHDVTLKYILDIKI